MISAVVLAAGRAQRLGEQKLFLPLRGKPVLQWVLESALASDLDEIVCVTRELGPARQQLKLSDERGALERIFDPFFTTKPTGTGLGMAIVKKIMEDHGGKLQLLDGEKGGASVRLTFPSEIVLADPALKSVQA